MLNIIASSVLQYKATDACDVIGGPLPSSSLDPCPAEREQSTAPGALSHPVKRLSEPSKATIQPSSPSKFGTRWNQSSPPRRLPQVATGKLRNTTVPEPQELDCMPTIRHNSQLHIFTCPATPPTSQRPKAKAPKYSNAQRLLHALGVDCHVAANLDALGASGSHVPWTDSGTGAVTPCYPAAALALGKRLPKAKLKHLRKTCIFNLPTCPQNPDSRRHPT